MKRTLGLLGAAAMVGVMFGGAAYTQAATVPLGASGWTASWDPSLDPYVDIHVVATDDTHVFIQKSAEFFEGPGPGGVYPSIPITFQQVAPSNLQFIVIEDEIITNSTGTDWTDFHMDLVGPAIFQHGPGFFFTTSPFDNQSFALADTQFNVNGYGLGPGGSNAVVADGATWFPGSGAGDGELFIALGGPAFTLLETPTPEPATLATLALGAFALRRGRSR